MASTKPISDNAWDSAESGSRSDGVLAYRRPASKDQRTTGDAALPPVILRIPDLEALEAEPVSEPAAFSFTWTNIAWWCFVVCGTVITVVLLAGGKKTVAPTAPPPQWNPSTPAIPQALPAFKAPRTDQTNTAQRPVYGNTNSVAPTSSAPPAQPWVQNAPQGPVEQPAASSQDPAEDSGPRFPDSARRGPARDPFALPDDRRDSWAQSPSQGAIPGTNFGDTRSVQPPVATADSRNSAADAARRDAPVGAQPPVARFNNTIGKPDIDINHDSPRQSLY